MATTIPPHPLRRASAELLYATLFAAVLPAALAVWAHFAEHAVQIPALHAPLAGAVTAGMGMVVMLAGMLSLWRRGGGLPMNAFPPPRFVAGGIYALAPHPIYGGFVLACGGVAAWAGSAAGLWLVTPAVAMGCAALVLGYEAPDLRRRFGAGRAHVWFPAMRAGAPSLLERLRVYPVVLLPWLAIYELIGLLGKAPDAAPNYLAFEGRIAVLPWAEPVYFSTYVAVLFAPLLMGSASALRLFALRALTAMALIFPLYLLLPVFVPPRGFEAGGWLGAMMGWERTPISGIGAFPSFHVVWALIVAGALGRGARWKRMAWWTWAGLVALSCIFTGMHSIADVAAGIAAYALIVNAAGIWGAILRGAEGLANSWKEWRMGPVRIINHGAYAGAAAAVGMVMIEALIGPGSAVVAGSIFLCSLMGAALWAQWVEGSPALLRPLGFYGGVLGAMVGSLVALPLHVSLWRAFAAVCVAAPWIQLLGRLRCLVQGCCHGHAAEGAGGIRYRHPRTRVCRLAHLAGVPIHATQVYSILWNVVVGAALLRLLELHAAAVFLCGIYFLLSGLGRFVEEAYRGEPQTRIVGGLRFYQWIAMASVIAGAALTCVRGDAGLAFHGLGLGAACLALGCGVLAWMVSGVDFPESTRRFARLT